MEQVVTSDIPSPRFGLGFGRIRPFCTRIRPRPNFKIRFGFGLGQIRNFGLGRPLLTFLIFLNCLSKVG